MGVEITESAAARFKQLMEGSDLLPRVEIAAGGCNGFDKRFSMDSRRDDDSVMELPNGAVLLVDTMSLDMLGNSRIDFKTGLAGSHFVIDIPEATSTCGCGSSFSF